MAVSPANSSAQRHPTLETLAVIKNPPAVFAKQANIAHGPQQVNNTVSLASGEGPPALDAITSAARS